MKTTEQLEKENPVSITLNLPPELEEELSAEANRLNLPLQEYVLRLLSSHPFLETPPQNGSQLVAYWENAGVINSRPNIENSQQTARKLRYGAEHRNSA